MLPVSCGLRVAKRLSNRMSAMIAPGSCCAITGTDTIPSDPVGHVVPVETVAGAICAPAQCSR
jgi:hypothetical protein